jgi:hypothetical protein
MLMEQSELQDSMLKQSELQESMLKMLEGKVFIPPSACSSIFLVLAAENAVIIMLRIMSAQNKVDVPEGVNGKGMEPRFEGSAAGVRAAGGDGAPTSQQEGTALFDLQAEMRDQRAMLEKIIKMLHTRPDSADLSGLKAAPPPQNVEGEGVRRTLRDQDQNYSATGTLGFPCWPQPSHVTTARNGQRS